MFSAVSVIALLASTSGDPGSENVVITGARTVSGGKIERNPEMPPPSWMAVLPKGWQPAIPAGNPGSWVTTEDYPAEALRNEWQGVVRFKLDVNAQGRVSQCTVTQSSGTDILDAKACSLISERAVFTPARDKRGRAVAGTYANAVRWTIPDDQSRGGPQPGEAVMSMVVNEDGSMTDCRIEKASEGLPVGAVGPKPCRSGVMLPYRDGAGNPVKRRVVTTIRVDVVPVD